MAMTHMSFDPRGPTFPVGVAGTAEGWAVGAMASVGLRRPWQGKRGG